RRQPAVDRADAGRGAGRDLCDRPGRRGQRGLVRRRNPRTCRSRHCGRARHLAAVSDRRRGGPAGFALMLPPGSTIGILGGGQLGRMTAMAAARLGYRTHVFAAEHDAPAVQVAATATIAPFSDAAAVARFAAAVDVATFEFENIPGAAVRRVAAKRPVSPRPEILEITQDRLREKNFLRDIGVATTEFREIADPDALAAAIGALGAPAVLE